MRETGDGDTTEISWGWEGKGQMWSADEERKGKFEGREVNEKHWRSWCEMVYLE